MEVTAMVFLLGALVVFLLGGFFLAWGRDKNRSDEVADDAARLDTDTTASSRGPDAGR